MLNLVTLTIKSKNLMVSHFLTTGKDLLRRSSGTTSEVKDEAETRERMEETTKNETNNRNC